MPLLYPLFPMRHCLFLVLIVFSCLLLCHGGAHAVAPTGRDGGGLERADVRDDLAGNVRRNAMAAYEEEDYEVALPLLVEAYALNPADIEVAGRLGYAAKETGAYEKALDVLEAAIAAQPDEYYYWWWLSDVQRLLGRYDAALKSMERARDLAPAEARHELQEYVAYTAILADDAPSWDNVMQHLDFAERHRSLRRVRRQIEEYIRALNVAPPYGPDDAEAMGRLAWIYQQIGIQYNYIEEPDVAVDYFLVALDYARKAGAPEDVMRNEQFLAIAFGLLADREVVARDQLLERAAQHWRDALVIAQDAGDVEYLRYTQGRLLETLARQRSLDDDELAAVRAANLKEVPWQGPVNEFSTADAVLGEAGIRLREGDYAGARILYEIALPYYEESKYLSDYHRLRDLYLALARVYYQQGHHEESLRHADMAAEKAAEARQFVDADAFNRSAGEHALRHIAAARARAYVALDLDKNAFAVIEAYKHQHLLNLLGSSIVDDAARTDAASEKTVTRERLAMLEQHLALAREAGDNDEIERVLERVARDKARLEWLERGVTFSAPRNLAFESTALSTADALEKALGGQAAFVSYLFDPWGGVAATLTESGITTALLALSDVEVRAAAVEVRDATMVSAVDNQLRQLHETLAAPIAEHLTGAVLIISPDAASDGVYFDALRDADEDWFGETFAVVYADTASQLVGLLEQETAAPTRLRMALGRPGLSDTRCESAATFQPVCLQGDKATMGAVISDVQPDELLHIACIVDAPMLNPMLAPLILDGGDERDELPAAALLGMKMPAVLVALDWRARVDGGAVPGDVLRVMTEAWRYAGARALLTTPIEMPEATRQAFFDAFYSRLGAGATMWQALQAAQQTLRAENPESLEWAGLQLRGDFR